MKSTFMFQTLLQQKVKAIQQTDINNEVFYDDTLKYGIINNLNFEELELLIDSIDDKPKKEVIAKIIKKEKHRWHPKIEEKYYNEIENSRISLNTTDFIAFCIGKKVDLQELNNNSLWHNIQEDLDDKLNQYLIRAIPISYFATSQKLDVTVNQALALFFCFDKKVALIKFKRIINYDRKYRPHASHEAEYFEAVRLFFDRLKLDFIPQIDFTDTKSLLEFSNDHKKYITKEEIQLIIDKENYFNKRAIFEDVKKIISLKNISNISIFKTCLLMFFENLDKNTTNKDIDIFVATLTEINSSFDDNEMKSTQIKLNSLLNSKDKRYRFIVLMEYLLHTNFLIESRKKISNLLSKYFNKIEGMGESNVKDFLYKREGRKILDYTKLITEPIKEKIDNSVKKK